MLDSLESDATVGRSIPSPPRSDEITTDANISTTKVHPIPCEPQPQPPQPPDTTPVVPLVEFLAADQLPSELSAGTGRTISDATTSDSSEHQRKRSTDLTQCMTEVTSSLESTLGSIVAVSDSLNGARHLHEEEEQLMMRDSPKWEEEELQAEEVEDPRVIKAEIKLMVKTTELGKESIEIRSIREFVEVEEKYPGGFGSIMSSSPPDRDKLVRPADRLFTLHRKTSPGRTPSPRFVRPLESPDSSYITEETPDDFNLMSQVGGKPNLACISF